MIIEELCVHVDTDCGNFKLKQAFNYHFVQWHIATDSDELS